ncbi:DUF2345 domain-containing protein, partial [Sapientia aquatica]
RELTFRSDHESIYITAKKKVVINGGGSFTEWSKDGITHGTNGYWLEHAAGHLMAGPKSMGVNIQGHPVSELYNERFAVKGVSGDPLPGLRYHLQSSDGAHISTTPPHGKTAPIHSKTEDTLQFGLHFPTVQKPAHDKE